MKRLLTPVTVLFLSIALLWPTPAEASLAKGLLKLAAGRADCRAKRFDAGLKKLLDSALLIQRANPRHAANRRWLPEARKCLRAWVSHTAKRCRKDGRVGHLKTFLRIKGKVKYLNAPVTKRLLGKRFRPCAKAIVKHHSRECLENPRQSALHKLDAIRKRLSKLGVDKRELAKLTAGRAKCAYQWVTESLSRCKTNATVAALKEIGAGVGDVGTKRRAKARAAYETCAKALGTRGWQVCQSRRYVQGRKMLVEAITRYNFFRARDKRFLATMKKKWLPRCGTYLVTGYFNMRVKRGKVSYKLAAKVRLEVSRTGKGNTMRGEMRSTYSAVSGLRSGCRVLITPTDGRYSLTGSENPAAKKVTIMLESGMPQTPSKEEIQVTCGDQTPDLFKTRFVHKLLKRAGVFSIGISSHSGAKKKYRISVNLGGGAKGSLTGALTLKPIK